MNNVYRIRDLEWRPVVYGSDGKNPHTCYYADTILGEISIRPRTDWGFNVEYPFSYDSKQIETLEEAKEDATKRWERQIREELEIV